VRCRHCNGDLSLTFLDLGSAPPSNAYLSQEELLSPETWYPLRLLVCTRCWLVQTEDYAGREALFTDDYAYFSSVSSSWLAHARGFVTEAVDRFELGPASQVVEVASNDGYLLQYVREREIPALGIEPTASTAAAARAKGIDVVEEFFGTDLAGRLRESGLQADLIVANNVLAHVPDINDFVAGFSILLKPNGVATFEFPHLPRMVESNQFDTAYHEHYSYLSLTAAAQILEANGLRIFDVREIPTHGGSLRLYAQRADPGQAAISASVGGLLERERLEGVATADYYRTFQQCAERVKNGLLRYLLDAEGRGRTVGGYGAAAKGSTLLNFAGVRRDLLPYVVDRSPAKQGCYLPGSRIPIVAESHLQAHRPDIILLLPWNLEMEITDQLAYTADWGAELIVAVPELKVATTGNRGPGTEASHLASALHDSP
jgi:predicted TPR repeat methyltransferase